LLHLPADPPLIHDFQDVPHGGVHQHTYRSKSLGRLRELAVYTPPGYDQQRDARFPRSISSTVQATIKRFGPFTARRTGFSTTSSPRVAPSRWSW
jgi:hypothetical protein